MSARISLTIEQFGDVTDRSGMRGVAVKATSRFASPACSATNCQRSTSQTLATLKSGMFGCR